MQITFTQDKETKNTVRFTSPAGDVSGSLYVRKDSDLASQTELTIEISEITEPVA